MKRFHILLCFVFLIVVAPAFAQDNAAPQTNASGTENSKKTPEGARAKRKKAKKEWKEHRKAEHDGKKAIKEHHKKIQSKDTLKRMKQSKKKSMMVNEHKREFFLKRWFKRKKRK